MAAATPGLSAIPIAEGGTSLATTAAGVSTASLKFPDTATPAVGGKASSSATALMVARFLTEVQGPVLATDRTSAVTTNTWRMAYEPGMPRPQDSIAFSVAESRFIQAARDDDVATLQQADMDMLRAFDIPFERRQRAHVSALIAAAECDTIGATQHLLREKEKSYDTNSKEWQGAIEAAFITACKCSTYDVVALYLGGALGETYDMRDIVLRPEIMAWGIYRSSETKPAHELLEKVKAIKPEVSRIYQEQMMFLTHAEEGSNLLVQEGLAAQASFVIREAGEKAIKAGHKDTFAILLPQIPRHWLPELIKISGAEGRVDIIDDILANVESRKELMRAFAMDRYIKGINPDDRAFYEDALIAEGIRGAASTGKLDTVKVLADRVRETGCCKNAAKAALEHHQLEVLSWAIAKVNSLGTEAPYEIRSLLPDLMTAALEKKDTGARDLLLREKGPALCVQYKHVAGVISAGDKDSYDAFINAGTPRNTLAGALRDVCYELEKERDEPLPVVPAAYILDLFNRTEPIANVDPANERKEEYVAEERGRAVHSLSKTNQHNILAVLLLCNHLPSETVADAFYVTVRYGIRESFDLLLPWVTPVEMQRAFYGIAVGERSWEPGIDSRELIPALIDNGSIDPDKLVKGAIRLSQREKFDDESKLSPGALSVVKHPQFPASRLNEVLIETGLNGNAAFNDHLVTRPEVNAAIGQLYRAVLANDLAAIAQNIRGIREGEEVVLRNAAARCIKNKFTAGALEIINQAAAKLDLSDLSVSAQYALDYTLLRELVAKGAQITERNIDFLVDKNDAVQLAILVAGQNASSAIAEYLKSLDAQTSTSATWLAERSSVLAVLRAQIGK
jgi:hypothetical protein